MPADQSFGPRYFDRVYRDYDRQNPPRKMAFYRRLVDGAVHAVATPRVLDLGCAFGAFLAALDPAWTLYGIDVSEYAVRRARARLPRAHIARSSAAAIPFRESFDVITAFDVIEHLDDPDRAAESIASSLAPHGRLIFVVPVYDGPLGPVVRALDRDPTHVHQASREFWLAWAARRFEIEDWHGIVRYLLPPGWYLHWTARAARRWAPAIAVVARRRS